MPHEPAPPLGLRLLLDDRYRVDARLLTPGARVDAVDTHAAGGRRVRVACLPPAVDGDGAAARSAAWEAAYDAGLPVCRALAAVDDEPGPLVVLEEPPGRPLAGDGPALAAQARLLAGALAERGLRAGCIPAGDLALDDAGGLILAVPPPVAPAVDPRAEAERLAATVLAAVDPAATAPAPLPATAGGALGGRLPGRRGLVRAAALAVAAAAALVLVGGGPRDGGSATLETAPAGLARAPAPLVPSAALDDPAGEADRLPRPPLRETAGSDRARPARRPGPARPAPTRSRPVRRPRTAAERPAPAAPRPPRARPALPPRRPPPAPAWSLGPDSALGPTDAGRGPT